jgi:hypothetical protein
MIWNKEYALPRALTSAQRSQVPNAHKCPTLTSAQRSQVPNAHKCPTLTSAQRSQVPEAVLPTTNGSLPKKTWGIRFGWQHACNCMPKRCMPKRIQHCNRVPALSCAQQTTLQPRTCFVLCSTDNTATAYLLCLVLNRQHCNRVPALSCAQQGSLRGCYQLPCSDSPTATASRI